MAELQAKWWNSPELPSLSFLLTPDLSQSRDELAVLLNGFTDKFFEIAGQYIPNGIESIARSMAEKMLDLQETTLSRQKTLVHGDYRTANILFDDRPDGTTEPIVFDWQATTSIGFANDISHFLHSSFEVETRRKLEGPLVDEYYETLLTGGVSDLSRADFENQIREALLSLFVRRIGALAMGGERMQETESGRQNLAAFCGRMQMLIDWNCDEVIPK